MNAQPLSAADDSAPPPDDGEEAPPAEGLPICGHRGVIRGCSACEEFLADWVRGL